MMSLKRCDLGFVASLLFPSELFTLLEAAFPFLCKSLSQLFCSMVCKCAFYCPLLPCALASEEKDIEYLMPRVLEILLSKKKTYFENILLHLNGTLK